MAGLKYDDDYYRERSSIINLHPGSNPFATYEYLASCDGLLSHNILELQRIRDEEMADKRAKLIPKFVLVAGCLATSIAIYLGKDNQGLKMPEVSPAVRVIDSPEIQQIGYQIELTSLINGRVDQDPTTADSPPVQAWEPERFVNAFAGESPVEIKAEPAGLASLPPTEIINRAAVQNAIGQPSGLAAASAEQTPAIQTGQTQEPAGNNQASNQPQTIEAAPVEIEDLPAIDGAAINKAEPETPQIKSKELVRIRRGETPIDTGYRPGEAERTAWLQEVGIDPSDWSYVDYIFTRESYWRPFIWNSEGSSAYGICQAMTSVHNLPPAYRDDPVAQVRWCHEYAMERYGSWKAAADFHRRNNYW